MNSTAQMFREVLAAADLLAAAIVRRQRPGDDEITQRQAYDEYGRRWIMRNTYPEGVLRPRRIGESKNSRLMYSRTEIAALMEVERQQRTLCG